MSNVLISPTTDKSVVIYDTKRSILLHDYRLTREVWFACAAALVYDYFLTLSDEIAYMWRGRWTAPKILFCIARYWTLINVILFQISWMTTACVLVSCAVFYWWFTYASTVNHTAVGLILILRIYAIYDCNRKLLYTLIVLFALTVTAETVFISFVIVRMHTAHMAGWMVGCIPVHSLIHTWAYWIPMVFFHGLLFLLILVKIGYILSQDGKTSNPGLMKVLLRDSVVSFGGALAFIVLNLVIWSVGRKTLWGVFPESVVVVDSIIGCRMLLNIRETAKPWRSRPWRQEDTAQLSVVWQWGTGDLSLSETGTRCSSPDSSDTETRLGSGHGSIDISMDELSRHDMDVEEETTA
ncbi:hypothetical protein NM688_g1684 [Phlebia brevispora]|uniref:Uncharacterized protein n=1 Tax=Phlebia brevispora TaxID=194682 RepID=A0ACC1TAM5_9APHY|nr:hypothetical protein NM688_g1684 [Phlebia brevispora]